MGELLPAQVGLGAQRSQVKSLCHRERLQFLVADGQDGRQRELADEPGPGITQVDSQQRQQAAPRGDEELQGLAMTQRLDLAALRTEVDMRRQQLTHANRWRWLGGLGLTAEREREVDGDLLTGGGGTLELPVFNSGKGKVLRASAQAESSAARLAGLETAIRNDIAVQVAALASARDTVEEYRTRLLPLHERIVEASQREQNFMLIGAFELLAARREELDTYERYVDAVRDYWVQRARLASAVGGKLPGDDAPGESLVLPEPAPRPALDTAGENNPGGAQ